MSIQGMASATTGGQPSASVQSAAPAPGRFQGESVTVGSASSALADAQEEVGLMRAGDKSLESRKPRAGVGSKAIDIELANRYLESQKGSDALEGGSADAFLDKLRERDGRRDDRRDGARDQAVRMRELLAETFPDTPHDRFALLVRTRERLQEDRDGGKDGASLYRLLETEIDRLSRESGPQLRAGFNVDAKAREHAGVDTRGGLTSFYTERVARAASMLEVYRGVSERYDRDAFGDAMSFLLGAASDDMASLGPSTDVAAIRETVDVIHRLQTLMTVREGCESAVARLGAWIRDEVDGYTVLESVLRLQEEQWPQANAVHKECRGVVEDTPQAAVAFHQQFCDLVERVPAKAFADEHARAQLVDTTREARDEAIAREEAEELERAEGIAGERPDTREPASEASA